MITGHSDSVAVTTGVFAALGYDITSANLSSPQTFELNAGQRAPTLQKWLRLNISEALIWGIYGSILDGSAWPLAGIGLAVASMWGKYQYAIRSGQRSGLPDMEDHQTGQYKLNGQAY